MTTDDIIVTGGDVLLFLRPNGGWSIIGEDFNSIVYDDGIKPITKEEYEEGFIKTREAKIQAIKTAKVRRQALLDKLGITQEEAQLLLGGN